MQTTAKHRRRALYVTAAALGGLLLGGSTLLHQGKPAIASDTKSAQAPRVEVSVLNPEPVRIWRSFSGRLAAVERVEIRPRVSGTIVEVEYREGARVEAGQSLYLIDPRPFEVVVARASAELDSARSRLDFARAELTRIEGLENRRVVSKSQVDSARNDFRVAQADVAAAMAALDAARLDLEFAHIKAPVSGRISRAEVTRGNLVEAGAGAPLLTTIVADDRLYVEFEIDEQTYLELTRGDTEGSIGVALQLTGESVPIRHGSLYAFDNALDSSTGTIRARALVDNGDGALVPGMFARVSVAAPGRKTALLVPERAVGTNQSRKFVYVVDDDNRVRYREVRLGDAVGDRRLVLEGLGAGERILVNSLQRVRPEMEVAPVQVTPVGGLADNRERGAVNL